MCDLCETDPDGGMSGCQDCGALICFDVESGDDIIRPAYVTESGDLFCDRCGKAHDRAAAEEQEAEYEPPDSLDIQEEP